jgi:hypothetical protein
MSIPQVKTPTLALLALRTVPIGAKAIRKVLEGRRGRGKEEKAGNKAEKRTFWLATEHHSPDDTTLAESTTHDLDHSHVVDVELHEEERRGSIWTLRGERKEENARHEGPSA